MFCCNNIMERGRYKGKAVRFCPNCGKTIMIDQNYGARVVLRPMRRGKKLAI